MIFTNFSILFSNYKKSNCDLLFSLLNVTNCSLLFLKSILVIINFICDCKIQYSFSFNSCSKTITHMYFIIFSHFLFLRAHLALFLLKSFCLTEFFILLHLGLSKIYIWYLHLILFKMHIC